MNNLIEKCRSILKKNIFISDDAIDQYIKESYLQQRELHILELLKFRYENNPTETNDKAWFEYSDRVLRRWKMSKKITFRRLDVCEQSKAIIEGFEWAKNDMQKKGLLKDETTWEEIAQHAGRHVLLAEEECES